MSHLGKLVISYSHSNKLFVDQLAATLQAAKIDLWRDKTSIIGNTGYLWDEIQSAIKDCTHFLFVASPSSLEAHSGALKELYYALGLRPTPILLLVIPSGVNLPYSELPLVIPSSRYLIHDFNKGNYTDIVTGVISAIKGATVDTIRKNPRAIFTELDIEPLADLLTRSGLVSGEAARRSTCRSVGLNPANIGLLGADRQFAVNFLSFLYQTANFGAMKRLCDRIDPLLYGQLHARLQDLCTRIQNLM